MLLLVPWTPRSCIVMVALAMACPLTYALQQQHSSNRKLTLDVNARHLPTELGVLTRLVELHIGHAPMLSGTLPTELAKLSRLWELTIEGAPKLSGTLPSSAAMKNLNRAMLLLKVQGTRISGTLPRELPGPCRWWAQHPGIVTGTAYNTHQCHFRGRLELCCNRLSGTLPAALRFGSGVAWLDLHGNSRLSGTLPSELASGYHRVDLRGTRLSGSIPSEVGAAPSLWALALPPPMHGWSESLFARRSESDERDAADVPSAADLLYNASVHPTTGTRTGYTRRVLRAWLGRLASTRVVGATDLTMDHATTSSNWSGVASDLTPVHATPAGTSTAPNAPLQCCIHGCHSRGECLNGWCACKPPWSGPDCGVRRTVGPAPPTCPPGSERGIYIGLRGYAITRTMPSARAERLGPCEAEPLAAFEPHSTSIYAAAGMLLLRLLRDERHRAASAHCAAARWDPLFGSRIHSNAGMLIKWQLQAALVASRLALDAGGVESAAAHVGAGSDEGAAVVQRPPKRSLPQIWSEGSADRGGCDAPIGIFQPGDIVLTHWGDQRCFARGVSYVIMPPGSAGRGSLGATTGQTTGGGGRDQHTWRARDARLVAAANATYGDLQWLHRPRSRALFFRGSVREKRHPREQQCYTPRRPSRHCRTIYSMGLRQMVHRLLGQHPMVHFNRPSTMRASADPATDEGSYHSLLRSYDFCLCAPGKGFGNRIVDYVASGCVPVIVRPGDLLMPLEPELDYDGFAVSVPFEAVPSLPSLLANMSSEALRRKRQRLHEVHRLFIWDEAYGQAYDAVLSRISNALKLQARLAKYGWSA